MSRRNQILKELGLTPAWRSRDAIEAVAPRIEPAPAAATTLPVEAPLRAAAVTSPSPAPQSDDRLDWLFDSPLPDNTPTFDADTELAPATDNAAARSAVIARVDWAGLQTMVRACQACKLCKTRKNPVFGVGATQADWLFVGEAPGAEEDSRGEPFVGTAGKLLDNMLAAISLQRGENVFIANVLKCRPPQNRDPEPQEIAQCEPFLRRQIELLQPKVIVALGRFAAQTLLGSQDNIGLLRGQAHEYHGVPLIVTYHPAYLLRQPADKAKAWADLCLARATLGGRPGR